MSEHDHPASRLLRDATDDLGLDVDRVDRVVRDGAARGRAVRRRRRLQTTLAAAAVVGVIGVIGVAAGVAPALRDDDPDPTGGAPQVAAETTAPEPQPDPTPEPSEPVVPDAAPAAITVAARDVPGIFGSLLGGAAIGPLTEAPYGVVDEPQEKIVHFRYDGTLTTFVIERASTLGTCAEMVDPADQPDGKPSGTCEVIDGVELLTTGPTTADGVTAQGVSAWTHGYVVSAISYDAADGKDVDPVADGPAISLGELTELVTSEVWFAELSELP